MIVIVATDDKQGMMFNNRRQSKDSELRKDILCEVGKCKLWLNAYSFGQFEEELEKNVCVAEDFVDKAGAREYCFVENLSLQEYEERIEELILYKWNRVYPSDLKFDIDLSSESWQMASTVDFVGSSHDKITKEVWKRV
ncbi:MAG: ribonuclease Z [Lachnospiraceae bacterium]|nr:ribonuclease Z [Lachnospiraceae bacterium]